MKRAFVLLFVILLLVPAAPAAQPGPRTEARAYVGSTGDAYTACEPGERDVGLGMACFLLDGSETTATIEVHDAHADPTPAMLHRIVHGGFPFIIETSFCDAVTVDVSGYDEVRVWFPATGEKEPCDGDGELATEGVVEATFERAKVKEPKVRGLPVSGASSACLLEATGDPLPEGVSCAVEHDSVLAVGPCTETVCDVTAHATARGTSETSGNLHVSASLWAYYPAWSLTTTTGACSNGRDLATSIACQGSSTLDVAVEPGACQEVRFGAQLRNTLALGVDAAQATVTHAFNVCRAPDGTPVLS